MKFRRLLVDDQIGALAAFAITTGGRICGLSANHVLSGSDGNLQTTDKVFGFSIATGDWILVGNGNTGFNLPGSQVPPHDYGRLDVGLFEVAIPSNIGSRLPINKNITSSNHQALLGQHLFAYSVMDDRIISGTVSGVFKLSQSGTPFDLIIESNDGDYLTKQGDSGLLWTDVEGAAVAIHIYGFNNPSQFSYCVFIDRICKIFGISELRMLPTV